VTLHGCQHGLIAERCPFEVTPSNVDEALAALTRGRRIAARDRVYASPEAVAVAPGGYGLALRPDRRLRGLECRFERRTA